MKPENLSAGIHQGFKNHAQVRKDKDPKSFTQNLFDTVAMKILHRANASDSHSPWALLNEKPKLVDSSNLGSTCPALKVDDGISNNARKYAALIPDTESARAALGCSLPRIESVPDMSCAGANTTTSGAVSGCNEIQGICNPEKDLKNVDTSGNDGKAHVGVDIEAKEPTLEAVAPRSKISKTDSQSEELDVAEMVPLHQTSVSVPSPSEGITTFPSQSLSHFTGANIIALKGARAVHCSDLIEQHWLLRYLGRTDLPQHSSHYSTYGDYLTYSSQSMTYILSNVDALLQSFLHVDDSNAATKVVWSYDFASIVDLFRKLRRIDMYPHKIFPSLWISAGKLYPASTTTNRRRSLTTSGLSSFSLDAPAASQGSSLNDLEACHVVKIALAALVASVPKCSPMGWLAVRKLHASGQVAPFIDTCNSPAEQKMIGKLVKTLQTFENEMALSLAIRLARSIDIRYHLARARALVEDVEKYRRQFPPTFSRVVDYINADGLKICVADSEGQPSIKSGEWSDPEIEPITWHPKELPIVIEWLRAVILKEWDGKPRVEKGSAVGGALGLMLHIRKRRVPYLSFRVLS